VSVCPVGPEDVILRPEEAARCCVRRTSAPHRIVWETNSFLERIVTWDKTWVHRLLHSYSNLKDLRAWRVKAV
jgi:hypothetical protein